MTELQNWLHSIREGDKSAFEALYNRMGRPLLTIIFQITQDMAQSEDILQELFIRLYLSPPAPSTNPRAYLCQMARNSAIDCVRKQKPQMDWEQAEKVLGCDEDNQYQALDIEEAIQSLADQEREIFVLHVNGGLKFREIAVILEIPLGTTLWAYQKAIKKLQERLGDLS